MSNFKVVNSTRFCANIKLYVPWYYNINCFDICIVLFIVFIINFIFHMNIEDSCGLVSKNIIWWISKVFLVFEDKHTGFKSIFNQFLLARTTPYRMWI